MGLAWARSCASGLRFGRAGMDLRPLSVAALTLAFVVTAPLSAGVEAPEVPAEVSNGFVASKPLYSKRRILWTAVF